MFRARKSYAFFGLKNVSFLGLFWLAHYCEVEKKNDPVCFLDIFISYKSYFKIFMVDVNKGHKFFSQNFTVEISTPVEYSTKNRFLHLWEKAQK